jgi:hypothetical protein
MLSFILILKADKNHPPYPPYPPLEKVEPKRGHFVGSKFCFVHNIVKGGFGSTFSKGG